MTPSPRATVPATVDVPRVGLLLAVEAAGVLVAWRLGRVPAYRVSWSELDTWLATSTTADAAVALLLPVVLALTGYLCVVTVLYVLALLLRSPRALARLSAVTPRAVRGLAERAVAVTVLTATWAGPAVAAGGAPAVLPPGLRVPSGTSADVWAPAIELPLELPHELPAVPPPEVAPPRTSAARTVTVVAGDHLWSIAARALADARALPVGSLPARDVAPYWLAVVRANAPHLRSGDPDLIHPGEVVRLPAGPELSSATG